MTEKCFHTPALACHLPVSQTTLLFSKMATISTWLKNINCSEKHMIEPHNKQ